MNRKSLIPLMALLILSIAAVAMAKGGPGLSDAKGQGPAISPENQKKLQEIFVKYDTKMHPLREEKWRLNKELDTLVESGQADKDTIHDIVKDLSENRQEIYELHKKMSAEIEKETGLVFPMTKPDCGFYGQGPCGFQGHGPMGIPGHGRMGHGKNYHGPAGVSSGTGN